MLLRFTKMHGLGNDFVVLDLISQNVHLRPEQIRELADRRTGIGFDQLLTVGPPTNPDLDFYYRIYNADGSEAEQCGNGARCVLRFVRDRGLTTRTRARFQTRNGCMEASLEKDGTVTVDMGAPRLLPNQVPFVADAPQITYDIAVDGCVAVASPTRSMTSQPTAACNATQASTCTTTHHVSAISIGNPHAVLLVEDVERAPVQTLGPLIESHPRFPERTNVGFMEIIDRGHVRLRVFERGVGETLACGSGACAAAVSGRLRGLLDEEVEVELPGGSLTIGWAGDDAHISMRGPVSRVYEGRLQI
ncbi:MAG: diaminopimelate epimerase [Gammaproteobacteria bacterium]|nr:diaminopimelate epimerase [Gammaproteobacteria bacterium]